MKARILSLAVVVFALAAGAALAQWDGQPTAPQAASTHSDYAGFDFQVHQRDPASSASGAFEPVDADHGPDCGASADNKLFPTHRVTTYEQAVYVCKDHVMTTLHGAGYGEIQITPSRLCDLSQTGQCIITWDMSTHASSTRDWVSVNISSFDDNLALWPAGPDLQVEQTIPGHWIQLSTEGFSTGWGYTNDVGANVAGCPFHPDGSCGWLADSKAVRDQFRIVLRQHDFDFGKISGEPGGAPMWFFAKQPHTLEAQQLVVQFGHHDYTAEKGECKQPSCPGGAHSPGGPGTWHWDNFNLDPSVPFTLIHCGPRAVTGSGANVTCNAPAPVGSYLRFPALGRVTVDGKPVAPKVPTGHPESQNNYFVGVPTGARSFTIGLSTDDWYGGPFVAQDFAIWSKGAPPSTPTPTSTPSPLTPSPSATATSTPTQTLPTPGPSATTSPSPTASAIPATSSPTATSSPRPSPTATRSPVSPTPGLYGCLDVARRVFVWFMQGGGLCPG